MLFREDVILILAAIIPAVVLLLYVYRKDRLEKEPTKLLLRLVLWGIVSTAMAAATETVGDNILSALFNESSLAYRFLLYFVVVAVSEEGFKFLMLKWKTWRNPEFNCQFDGIVYAVFVSLGFALWENIHYVISYGMATAIARALTAIPGHACFGVFMGVFYGAAKRAVLAGNERHSRILRKAAVIVPSILHGAYDFFATSLSEGDAGIFILFVIVFFLAAFRVVKKEASNDRYIS